MLKSRAFKIFAAVLFINFCLNTSSFAAETTSIKTCCPDYACEFCGKDKCENFNRKMYIFNTKVNKYVIRPVNIVWASVMPQYGMDRVQSFYTNIEFPIRFASCLLQKDFKSSKKEALRFITNTTIGLGGLYDPAKNKFKLEPCQEDMSQALAHFKRIKKGPYIVLPIVAQGNVRDLVGQLLDYPLNPSSYIIGPAVAIAKAVSVVNKTAYMQPLAKAINSTYADPYEITKKLFAVEKYIKCENLDRKEVLAEKTSTQSVIPISNMAENPDLKPDIALEGYNPQSPLVDSMRTAFFEAEKMKDKRWSELSIWNRNFEKKIKTSSVNIDKKCQNYKYRYLLQKDKTAPLAIIYPSFGEGILSHHSVVLSKLLYDEGYSVVIQGSPFQWEFIKSMPETYKPGFPTPDTYYSRILTSKILNTLSEKGYKPNKKILIGTSFGALTTLFTAAKEEEENTLGISNYISINPPIEILYALKQLDEFSQDWKKDPTDIKMKMAITAEKIIQVAQAREKRESLPFTDDEAKLVIGFVMQQKLSDLVFTIEKASKSKKSDFYQTIGTMSFKDYAKKYLLIDDYKSYEKLNYDTSLYSLANFLQKNEKYKIYHSVDDYYVNPEQLIWLKKQTANKSVYFNNGSHLGELYRKEFIDAFKKDIKLKKPSLVNVSTETSSPGIPTDISSAPEDAVPEDTVTKAVAPKPGL